MNFVVRPARPEDLGDLYGLARQFDLLNLPPDKAAITQKIEKSEESFKGALAKEEAQFLFVAQEVDTGAIGGSSQIVAKDGTPEIPSYSFQVLKKERFSRDLGLGFIHTILRLRVEDDGPTEIGGLVVDRTFRRRPEKIGKTISLSRFVYIALWPHYFQDELLAEMVPPLGDGGRSEFWEALGRRFTGMPYQEADSLSHQNKEFIQSLFPEEDIYLCLLDAKARLVLGRVGEETQAARYMLEKIGFQYNNEVDPFDGGPHLMAKTADVSLIRDGQVFKVKHKDNVTFERSALVGLKRNGGFLGGNTSFCLEGDEVIFPEKTRRVLDLGEGEEVFVARMS
jgi:arginine N-succinyltransferase